MTPDEQLAIHVASIMGEQCAAAQALEELHARRAGGEATKIARHGRMWLVYTE